MRRRPVKTARFTTPASAANPAQTPKSTVFPHSIPLKLLTKPRKWVRFVKKPATPTPS